MEDQTRFGRSRWMVRGWAVIGLATALATLACSGPEWHRVAAVRPGERTPQTYCAIDRETVPSGRVVNYVDPELCGRYVRDRSDYTVRVPPLDRPSTQSAR